MDSIKKNNNNNNNLAERDKFLDKILIEIKEKKKMLLEIHNNNYKKNNNENKNEYVKKDYNEYVNSQLQIYEKQLEKLRSLLEQNDLLALEIKDDVDLLKEIKSDQTDIYAEIKKIEKDLKNIS